MLIKNKRVGTLLPLSSVVSRNAPTGTFESGQLFLNWLIKTKQSAWQVLPLHETQLQIGSSRIHVPSPYKGYGIGIDPKYLGNNSINLSNVQIRTFVKNNKYWIHGYSLFCALRDYFKSDDWSKWPAEIKSRNKSAIKYWQNKLRNEIDNHAILQAKLHFAYQNLQDKARKNNILMIGDMPFYLGLNGPLVWEYQHLFDINDDGSLTLVSGVLPGSKSHYGRQVWGHPLYKWDIAILIPEIYKLIKKRIRYLSSLYNYVRFDHAKGLFSYGAIDIQNPKNDTYKTGPGKIIFEKIIKFAKSKKLKIYAEDTGDKLKSLRDCLHIHHVPGIKIFRFAYNEKRQMFVDQYLRTSQYPANTIAYTTTHDTEPLISYLKKLSKSEIRMLSNELRIKLKININELASLIRQKVIKSPAKIVLVPLQDWLLTPERINTPGTERAKNDPNWRYQMSKPVEDLPAELL